MLIPIEINTNGLRQPDSISDVVCVRNILKKKSYVVSTTMIFVMFLLLRRICCLFLFLTTMMNPSQTPHLSPLTHSVMSNRARLAGPGT